MLLTLLSGLLVDFPRGAGWFMLCVIMPSCLGRQMYGPPGGLHFLLLLLILMMLVPGPWILVKWVAFLGSLRWPAARDDLWVGGVYFVELLRASCSLPLPSSVFCCSFGRCSASAVLCRCACLLVVTLLVWLLREVRKVVLFGGPWGFCCYALL